MIGWIKYLMFVKVQGKLIQNLTNHVINKTPFAVTFYNLISDFLLT